MNIAKNPEQTFPPGTTIAVLGAAFNPPHSGHVDVIQQALERADGVALVPSFCHAFGKHMAPFEQRMAMVKVLEPLFNNTVKACDIEQKLSVNLPKGNAIYTYDVLAALTEQNPGVTFVFVVGPDNAKPETWNTFYRAQDILDRWQLFKAQENIAVRSTAIRESLKKGILPSQEQCPDEVIEILKTMDFYRGVNK